MRLSTEAADQGKWATFSADVNDIGEVVFKVWPNDSDDSSRNRGPVEARWDTRRFNEVMDLLRVAMRMSKESKEWKDKVEYADRPWIRGEGGKSVRGEKPVPMWATWVGTTEDGKIWISLQVFKRPNIQFFFGKDLYNFLYHGNGQPYSDAEVSRARVSGWVESLIQIVPPLIASRYNHEKTLPKQKQNNGGQGQSNYNQAGGNNNGNRGGQSGGYSGGGSNGGQRSDATAATSDNFDEVEDDLPF